jgi:tetratricopeptide (TPR) repeat protein
LKSGRDFSGPEVPGFPCGFGFNLDFDSWDRKLKQADPSPNSDSNYGLMLLHGKKFKGALHHLSKAARSAPADLNIQVNKAAALWACGRRDEAIAAIREVMDADPPPATELEVNALFLLAAPAPASAKQTKSRMKELIKVGTHVDGVAVRGMYAACPQDELDAAIHLAEVIEGKIDIPEDW